MTDEQVSVIEAASILRTDAAELQAVLNFIAKDIIAEVGTTEFMARPNAVDIMQRTTLNLYTLGSRVRRFRDEFEGLSDGPGKTAVALSGESEGEFKVLYRNPEYDHGSGRIPAGDFSRLIQPDRSRFERADGTIDFRAAAQALRK